MALIDLASGASMWRGYEYYQNKKVKAFKKVNDHTFEADVLGSGERKYRVIIDVEHPRSSKCDCPHAEGRRIVCKHMVALYFAAFPQAAQDYYNEVMQAEEAEEARQEELEALLIAHVSKMKKPDLQEALLQLLLHGPEWQYDNFLQENIKEYWDR